MFKKTFTAFIIAGLLIVQAQQPPKASKNKATPKASSSTKTASKPIAKALAGKVNYTINGKVEGYPNHLVILNKFRVNSLELVDSTMTNDSGYFSIPIKSSKVILFFNALSRFFSPIR